MITANSDVGVSISYPLFIKSDLVIAGLGALIMAVAGLGSAQWFSLHLIDPQHASEPVVQARVSAGD